MSGPGGEVIADIIATRPPQEVVHPHGKNAFALEDGAATEDSTWVRRASATDVEAVGERTPSVVMREKYPIPTAEEASTLRKVADSLPYTAYMLCAVEFAERASYYGVQTIFSNFMQYPLPPGGNGAGAPPRGTQETAGALGRGVQFAVAIGLVFTFLAYTIPIPGGWVADAKWGRYKTILVGVLICGVAHIILIVGAIPSVLQDGKGTAPFMLALFILAIGAGIFKPNVAPLLLDQYQHQRPYTKVLKSGEKVVVDPEVTVQRAMLYFYALINVGAIFPLATTYSEKYVGYWLAYLESGIIYFLLPFLLWFLHSRLIKHKPNGSALTKVFQISIAAVKHNKFNVFKKDFWATAMPSNLRERGITTDKWTDRDVKDVQRTLQACAIFLYFPIYNINDNGVGSVQTAQASTMTTNGAPNDILTNFNALTIIVAVPILSYIIYPALRKWKIKFGRVDRITFGFTLAWISGIFGAIVQWKIYTTSPGGYYATNYAEANGGVSPLSIWWSIPNTAFGALSECFCNVTAYELAYARSPEGMKALVVALFLFANAIGAALGLILTPVIQDPYLIWIWGGPAIVLFVQTVIFHFRYRKLNDDEFMLPDEEEERKVENDDSVADEGGKQPVEKEIEV